MSERRRMVRVGQALVGGAGDQLVTLGLGSCVAILLYDPRCRLGGLAHALLPHPLAAPDGEAVPAKFVSTAVPYLLGKMEAQGARSERMVARLVGGASMFASLAARGTLATGPRNVEAAREALRLAGIPIGGEDVGEEHGRSVYFETATGRVVVTAALRERMVL